MAHTPGPWGMPDSGKGLVSKKTPHGWDGMIASADCGGYARSRTEGLANARLIAAEPELLEALRKMDALMEMLWKAVPWGKTFNLDAAMLNEYPLAARRAIAKATGAL